MVLCGLSAKWPCVQPCELCVKCITDYQIHMKSLPAFILCIHVSKHVKAAVCATCRGHILLPVNKTRAS